MFKKLFPYFILFGFTCIIFRKFIFEGLLPIPADILIGAYFPWLDYKWGYTVGVPVKNPLPSDVISILYPWRTLGLDMIKQGILPLWDNTHLLGLPLLANFQSALLNPLNVLFFIFDKPIAWSIQVFLQPIFITIFTYWYLRNRKLHTIPSLFGSIAYGFSGLSIVWMEYNTIGYTLSILPLALLLIDKLVQIKKIYYSFLLALALTFQVFSGYPQITIYTIGFSTFYLLTQLNTDFKKIILLYILGIFSALLLSSVQLIPSQELLEYSIRSVDQTAVGGNIQFLPSQHLITMLIPDFFGNPATGNYWSVGSYDNFAFSISSVALFFTVFYLINRKSWNRLDIFFLISGFVCLLVATDNPFSQILINYDLLGLKSAVAVRILFIFGFILSIFAALGLEHFLYKSQKNIKALIISLLVISGTATVMIVIYYYIAGIILTIETVIYNLQKTDLTTTLPPTINKKLIVTYENLTIAVRNSIIPIGLLIITFLISIIKQSNILFLKIKSGLFLMLICVSIFFTTDKYLTFIDKAKLYPTTEATTYLQNQVKGHRFEREMGEIIPSNTWIPYGLKSASGQNALALISTAHYINLINRSSVNRISRYFDIRNYDSPLFNTLDIEYISFINRDPVKFVPTKKGIPFPWLIKNSNFQDVKNINSVRIYKNNANLGFAWFADTIICKSSNHEIIEKLSEKDFSSRLAVLNCPSNEEKVLLPGNVQFISNNPLEIVLKTESDSENYLLLSHSYYPGWNGYIDGHNTEIKKVNMALAGIKVPEGKHTIKLQYEPKSFYIGAFISILTFILWILYLILRYATYKLSEKS